MSSGCRCHRKPTEDTRVSAFMLDRALEEINKIAVVDREHDIPYLAGYSKDGSIIYIDRHLPSFFLEKGYVRPIDRFLILHESIEKALIDKLNLHYQHAHQIALRAEEAAVRSFGISWSAYNAFTEKYIKQDADEKLSKVPADLDLKPYIDEHDDELLVRMKRASK